jgi:bis(5'-nucleosyl)-tetraphosphatase (symmetrical)
MPTYLIGDIQGCYDPLQRLLEKIRFDTAQDQLWFCGDLVNRGGKSLKTLRLLKSMQENVLVTLGNHDLHLLAEAARFPEGGSVNRELNKILKAHDREPLLAWLQNQPLAHRSKEHDLLLVHAGVIPQWSAKRTIRYAREVEQVLRSDEAGKFFARMYKRRPVRWNDKLGGWKRLRLITNILTRTRFCDSKGRLLLRASGPPGSQPKGYKPWFAHKHRKTKKTTVAFGHWAALGLYIKKKRLIGLDSGCVWGGRLSAVRLEDRELFQVEGKSRKSL